MMLKIALLVSASMFGTLFVVLAAFVVLAMRQGYGIELRLLGYCAAFAVAAVLSFGTWLFIKAK